MTSPTLRPLTLSDDEAREVEAALDAMDLRALALQLGGRAGLHAVTPWTYRLGSYRSGGFAPHGIPPLRFTDGPRGCNLGRSTAFPSASTRGFSWDTALEERVGAAIGAEARAEGGSAVGSACINLVRHPAWGRAQESLGADPHHVGKLGAAHVRGLRQSVLPVVKHFALNSIENSRFYVDVTVDETTLRELYLPHFFETLDAGAGAVMTAYNKVNGTYCGEHPALLGILKDEWGFEGFATSDFVLGTRSTVASMRAGLDQEMPEAWYYRPGRLARHVRRGALSEPQLRAAARRILRARAACGVLRPGPAATVQPEAHQALAQEAACASMVLARDHDALLPLPRGERLGVVGALASQPNLGSTGSVSVAPPFCVTPLAGLREAFPRVVYEPRSSARAIARLAARVDRLVVVVGAGARDEGEYFPLLGGGDRRSLALAPRQVEAVRAALRTGRPTVVVWVGGGLPALGDWAAQVRCLLFMGHGGMLGGRALGQVLAGEAVPGGHLSACVAHTADALTPFDPAAKQVHYDRFFDYRRYDRDGGAPMFWVGHGSAQTQLHAEPLGAELDVLQKRALGVADTLTVTLRVRNDGPRAATPLLLLYVGSGQDAGGREPFQLRAFAKTALDVGETRDVPLSLPVADLREWDPERGWALRPGPRTLLYSLCGAPRVTLGTARLVV